jgi:hypothetical protein
VKEDILMILTKRRFDPNATVEVNQQSVQPSPDGLAGTWRVTEKAYSSRLGSTNLKPGSFTFALASLQDSTFATSTIFEKSKENQKTQLKSQTEILANTM